LPNAPVPGVDPVDQITRKDRKVLKSIRVIAGLDPAIHAVNSPSAKACRADVKRHGCHGQTHCCSV